MKALKVLMLLFVLFTLFASAVKVQAANPVTEYDVRQIDVDGTTVFLDGSTLDSSIEVDRGESMVVEVWIEGLPSADPDNPDEAAEVRVRAELDSNYEDDIEAKTQLVSVFPGTTKKVTLRLTVPQDIDADYFDLLVTVSGGDQDAVQESVPVKVSGARHYLNIVDSIISPGTTIEAGKTVFAKVRVENLGQLKEEDIRVEMSIPELGLSTRTYIDELVPEECSDDSDNSCNEDEETSMTSPEMFLKLPEDANGKYTLKITVTYNRGRTTEEQTFDLLVKGKVGPVAPTATVSIDTTSQSVEAGKGVVYKLMFANLGQEPVTYSVDVAGVSAWGSSRVDPDTVTVLPDSTADMFVFVAASETTPSGPQTFTLNVKQDGQIVKQLSLRADVTGKAAAPSDSYKNIRQGLEVGFIVLLIILVILGLILAARKLGGGPKESMEEPSSKTYY